MIVADACELLPAIPPAYIVLLLFSLIMPILYEFTNEASVDNVPTHPPIAVEVPSFSSVVILAALYEFSINPDVI